jgi:hypothetical protein
LLEQAAITDQRIANFQGIISDLRGKDSLTVASYTEQIRVMGEQRGLLMDTISGLNKQIRKLNRRIFWSRVAGGVGIAAMGYLWITK